AVLQGRPRCDPRQRGGSRLHPQVASADRDEGRGAPLRPGRFAGRDRAGHRQLDGDMRAPMTCGYYTAANNHCTPSTTPISCRSRSYETSAETWCRRELTRTGTEGEC